MPGVEQRLLIMTQSHCLMKFIVINSKETALYVPLPRTPCLDSPTARASCPLATTPSLLTVTRAWIGSVQRLGPAVHTQDSTPNPEHAQCLWPLSPSRGVKRLLPGHSASAAPGTGQGPETVIKGHSRCVSTWPQTANRARTGLRGALPEEGESIT